MKQNFIKISPTVSARHADEIYNFFGLLPVCLFHSTRSENKIAWLALTLYCLNYALLISALCESQLLVDPMMVKNLRFHSASWTAAHVAEVCFLLM